MMIHPEGKAVFVEVPKTGSTAATKHLNSHGWFQNGARGYAPMPASHTGRHGMITDHLKEWLDEHGVTVYGVVRNPWDRMASLWRSSSPGTTPFDTYMKTGKFVHGSTDLIMTPQHEWLRNVDVIMRYERLAEDWDYWSDRYNELPRGPLPVVNRSKDRSVPEWTEEEINMIAERYAIDIETYGYEGPS